MIKITRRRWVIVRDGKDIFCGLARNFQFKPISELGNAAVKTYLSRNKAISAFELSWHDEYDDNRYKAVEVVESIETLFRAKNPNEETQKLIDKVDKLYFNWNVRNQ